MVKTCYLLVLCLILTGCGWNPKPKNVIGFGVPASQVMPVTTVPRHLSVSTGQDHFRVEARGQPIVVVGGPAYVNGHWVDTAQAYSFTYGYTNEVQWEQFPQQPNFRIAPGQVQGGYQEFIIPVSPPGIRR